MLIGDGKKRSDLHAYTRSRESNKSKSESLTPTASHFYILRPQNPRPTIDTKLYKLICLLAHGPPHTEANPERRQVALSCLRRSWSLLGRPLKTIRYSSVEALVFIRKGPRTQIIEVLGPKYYNLKVCRALKPYYLGPWTLNP